MNFWIEGKDRSKLKPLAVYLIFVLGMTFSFGLILTLLVLTV